MIQSFLQKISAILIGLILLFPVLVLIWKVPSWQAPSLSELLPIIGFTSLQALLSTFFSITLGFFSAVGMLKFQGKRFYPWMESFLLLPSLLPQILLIVATMNVVQIIGPFPFGLWGIVILHSFFNIGLVTIFTARLLNLRAGGMIELAWIEGAKPYYFLIKCCVPLLKREISLLAFTIFVYCFSSFAIPLVAGGVNGTTLEVLIFEKIRFSQNWSEAFVIGFIQIGFLFLFSFFLAKSSPGFSKRKIATNLLHCPILIVPVFLLTLSLAAGPFIGALKGLEILLTNDDLLLSLFPAMYYSILVALGVGGLIFILLNLVAFSLPHPALERFLSGYIAPSSVLTGFALILFGGMNERYTILKLILGISLISFPALYRVVGESHLQSLKEQVVVARTMSASWFFTFRKIVYPQTLGLFFFISGLASFWAVGDFALSSMLAGKDLTLALLIDSYLGKYQMEMATVLLWPLVGIGSFCFIFWGGLGRVFGRKSNS